MQPTRFFCFLLVLALAALPVLGAAEEIDTSNVAMTDDGGMIVYSGQVYVDIDTSGLDEEGFETESTDGTAAPVITDDDEMFRPVAEPAVVTVSGVKVEVLTLGTISSSVRVAGNIYEVLTSCLSFGGDVPTDKLIAVVNATRTGQCTMHNRKSIKSYTVLHKIPHGRLVGVMEIGKKWTKIVYKGEIGYVLTNALSFINPNSQPMGTGIISLKGRATGRTAINIRGGPSANSRIVTEWKTASEVIVWGKENGFYEVEYKGMRGYIQEKYLTPDDSVLSMVSESASAN